MRITEDFPPDNSNAGRENDLQKQAQAVIIRMLQDSLDNLSLHEHMEEALFLVFAIPWISLESMGSIHVFDKISGNLILVAEQGLPGHISDNSQQISLLDNLYGKAARDQEMLFATPAAVNNDSIFAGVGDYGLNIIPILFDDELLGMLTLFVHGDHQVSSAFSTFCRAITSTLAGIIVRCQKDLDLKIANAELDRANKFIRETFGTYLSKEIVDNILDTPEGLSLGGEEKFVTVLMTDLRGFTSMSGRMPPEEVLTMLNIYLGEMTNIILDHKGTIIEFLGDGILAIFGAPITRDDDARRAVACALAMQKVMPALNVRNKTLGYPELAMGAGINSGMVVAGNIGSTVRRKYGVVGNTINLAARIESLTVGGQVLISEHTAKACKDQLHSSLQWQESFKGVAHPITISHIVGIGGADGIHLPQAKKIPMQPIAEVMRVELTVIVDTHIDELQSQGKLVALGLPIIEIETALQAKVHTNVKIALYSVRDELITDQIYGKVIPAKGGGGRLQIHLTSIPPLVEELLYNIEPNIEFS